mmetsp:Transcript_18403/g.51571  ORF Transcript_18403/g.51571 Transcript_18403/m.51571 type:complete len:96 (+) Transcript_18403:261-548(+)|eukprot:CAMPEP_0117684924 /NCGR_PEP_ID=MMETSP0804-20121206/21425_1 /TAXON_ID=1074897 /ORGANISM="Tetraselmis astigmatica, Strain CCMP880" /LENGTH=95 /DNA_ID=CAMNT_0005496081 /DNA_START=183 /DNA_END=470 /DNA_ORIENTATION=+
MASLDSDPLVAAQHPVYEKVCDLKRGAFGFLQLARRRDNGKAVAIKFIERGGQVGLEEQQHYLCGAVRRGRAFVLLHLPRSWGGYSWLDRRSARM